MRVICGIAYGLFAFPCLLEENKIDVTCVKVIFGILLLPITAIYLVILGIYTMFDAEGRQHFG
jgi:hypothetical protein